MAFRPFLRSLVLLSALSASYSSCAERVITSAVSEQFSQGMHFQLLQYFATKLDVKITISYMPYARRLRELDNGNLDLIVGVIRTTELGNNSQLLQPAYESLDVGIFALANNVSALQSKDASFSLAVTRATNYYPITQYLPNVELVLTTSIGQKISMLMKHRIDSFLHLTPSAMAVINEQHLAQQIKLVPMQLPTQYAQFIAINNNSWVAQHKAQLQQIVRDGITQGDFARIRAAYYANQKPTPIDLSQ